MINLVLYENKAPGVSIPWSQWKQGMDKYPELTPYSPAMRVGEMTYEHLTAVVERATATMMCLGKAFYVAFDDISHLEKLNKVLKPSLLFWFYEVKEDKGSLLRLSQQIKKPLKRMEEDIETRVKHILSLPLGKPVALAMSQLRHRVKGINRQLDAASVYFPDVDINTPEELTIENGILRIKGIE